MLIKRIINPSKKNKINGNIFFMLLLDNNMAVLFDQLFDEPIIYAEKPLVESVVRNKLPKLLNVETEKIQVHRFKVDLNRKSIIKQSGQKEYSI